MNDFQKTAKEMLDFIEKSPTCFHAVVNIGAMLEEAGYVRLRENEEWKLVKGGKYYTERNDSSVIAFAVPTGTVKGFHMAAAHSDSPCFKVKEKPELTVEDHYMRLNTEKYGGMILSTWMDRPLSVAGRLAVRGTDGIQSRLVNIDRDLCVIPNVAIHMNREMNKGVEYNPQVDMLPLFADVAFDTDAAGGICDRRQITGEACAAWTGSRGSRRGCGSDSRGRPVPVYQAGRKILRSRG